MKLSTLLLSASTALSTAAVLEANQDTKMLHLPFTKQKVAFENSKDMKIWHQNQKFHNVKKRDTEKTLQISIDNYLTYYNIEIGLGTPSQTFNLLLDTGSSDMWVIGSGNEYCTENPRLIASLQGINCSVSGVFTTDSSSTFSANNTDFYIAYGDKTVAEGDWATDTLTINGVSIKKFSFGLGATTNSSMGVLGIGYKSNEATNALKSPYTYENLPLRLAEQGVINTPAYSMWLNDINSDSGNILFGAVDHDKYNGSLVRVPIQSQSSYSSGPTSFLIDLQSVKYSESGSSSSEILSDSIQAVLDSGTSLSYFPSSIASKLLSKFSASYNSQLGYYLTSCNTAGMLTYNFTNAIINVPFEYLLIPVQDSSTGEVAQLKSGEPACAVGILPAEYKFALLGDTFMRNAYSVFDLKNNEIALAQAVMNVTSTNLEVIKNKIPDTPGTTGSTTSSTSSTSTGSSSSSSSTGDSNGSSSIRVLFSSPFICILYLLVPFLLF